MYIYILSQAPLHAIYSKCKSIINMLGNDVLNLLYKNLLRLKSDRIEESPNEAIEKGTDSSSSYFDRLLQKIFTDRANIVELPPMRASTSEEIWQHYISQIRSLIAQGTSELVKPIVAIWNKEQILKFKEENKVPGLYCWDIIVIIPKHYTSCIGVNAKNQSEKIFLKYSEINSDLTKYVRTMLSKEYTEKLDIANSGLFTNPEFIEDDSINMQELTSRNTGWWTLYNVCMILMKLSIPSLNKFTTKSIVALEPKIRSIISAFGLLTEKYNEVKVVECTEKVIDTSIHISQPLFQVKGDLDFRSDHSKFIEFVKTSKTFVDKSLFIKQILRYEGLCRIIILRPRRWGKTLNLSMLKEFLSLEINAKTLKKKKHNENYNLFATGKYKNSRNEESFIKKLQIAEIDGGIYLKDQGRFPVISIEFNHTQQTDFIKGRPTFATIRRDISRAYLQHNYILDFLLKHLSSESHRRKREPIEKTIDIFNGYLNADKTTSIGNSIYFLGTLLHKYLNRKVYVLIDEYDAPLTKLRYNSKKYKLTKEMLIEMFKNGFKIESCGTFLEKVILTGVFRVKLTSLGQSSTAFRK